jgi:integrase
MVAVPKARAASATEGALMAARKDTEKGWVVDFVYQHPDGRKERVRKTSPVQNRPGAEQYERQIRQAILEGRYGREEVPTFEEWFHGRFWTEWVIGHRNKPSEQDNKKRYFRLYLRDAFGRLRLDEIDVGAISQFKAHLVKRGLDPKTINNALTVVSKALRYAADVDLIQRAPKVGLFKVERPEYVAWEIDEYVKMLAAARAEGPEWHVAVCLAGEAGLRIGEVRGLRWDDVDLEAATITVAQQMRKGIIGTPKGRTRRVVPMTPHLLRALRGLEELRRGFVVRNLDCSPMTDGQTTHVIYRMCDEAELPHRGWHVLRHAFGTHAALFGANPWRLMLWLGHKRIDETMIYVNLAEAHKRTIPPRVLTAGANETDPDQKILKMLGARDTYMAPSAVAAIP